MTIQSALWDHPNWDGARWDSLVAEITSGWTSDDDQWQGNVYVYDPFWVSWTSDDDTWQGSVAIYVPMWGEYQENPDTWEVDIHIKPPDESYIDENPDIWSSLIYVTLHPPIYSAGGGWWINVWGDRLPTWKERRDNLENAYSSWRYKIKGAWTAQDSTWGGSVKLASVSEERLQQQIRLMFGAPYEHDEDEDILWLI